MPDEKELLLEWRKLRARDYAEEGIPMLLGVETVGQAPPCLGEPALAAQFRILAEALGATAPAEPAETLELIAAREMQRLG